MGRRRTRAIRLALVVGLAALVVAVAATVAHALAFDDGHPCPVGAEQVFTCPSGTVESPYSVQIVSKGGCGPALPYQYRVLNGALPPGISLASSGVLNGTPTTAGNYRFWVELSDENPPTQAWCRPETAQREFSIAVIPRVLVTTASAAPGTIGAPYSLALVAVMKSGPESTAPPSSPLSWTVVGGALPAGLALNGSTGVISGTPTAEGASSFVVRAALADGRADTKGLTITVRQPLAINAPRPFATSPAPTAWEVSVPFSGKLAASGGSGAFTFTLAGGALPTGLALAADGTVSGTPNAAGIFRATIRLADTEGRTLDYAANFAVAQKLAISTMLLRPGKVGRLYKAKLATSGGIAPRTWRVVSGPLPKGIKLDRKLGSLAGVPKKAGSYRVRFEAKDGLKVVAQKTLRIVVLP